MKISENGQFRIPSKLRHRYGFHPGVKIDIEAHPEGLLLRPAKAHREHAPEWMAQHESEMVTLRTDEIMRLLRQVGW